MTAAGDELLIGLVSISDRASSGVYRDEGIPALEEFFGRALTSPWRTEKRLIPDEGPVIESTLVDLVDREGCHLVLTTGGTGPALRDVTPEAVEPLFEKRMDGFSIAFHMLSHAKIGTSTIQSRATAGVAGATFIFCLPGSPGACRDAWDGILAAQLDYRTRPCNFVEIMPRLDEHLRRPKAKGASA